MEEKKPIIPPKPEGFPKMPAPEPLQMPRPGPAPIEAPTGLRRPMRQPVRPPMRVPDIRAPLSGLRPVKPHVYVKVSSYKQIMDKIDEMSKEVGRIRNLLSEMDTLTRQEAQKLGTFNQVLSRLRQDLEFVENTFTQPEE